MRELTLSSCLPADAGDAVLVGRAFVPAVDGPSVVVVRDGALYDLSPVAPTISALAELDDPARAVREARSLERIGDAARVLGNTPGHARDRSQPWLLAPVDLHALKAAGVTFVASMLERVI